MKPSLKLDAKDRAIVAALQKDGRLSNVDLAAKVNLSPSPCLRRVRLLEEAGIIKGYSAVIDEKAYGLPIVVFVEIRLQQHSVDVVRAFEEKVEALENIVDCYVMTGDFDYMLKVLVASLEHYEQFVREHLHNVKSIAAIRTSFAYSTVKRSKIFPINTG